MSSPFDPKNGEQQPSQNVLDILSNARTAAKSARGPIISTAPYGSKIPFTTSSPTSITRQPNSNTSPINPEEEKTLEKFETNVLMNPMLLRNNNNNLTQSGGRPLSAIHRSLKDVKEHQQMMKKQAITPDEANWFDFVSEVSARESHAANIAASMKIENLDEHGQLESDFLSGLDEETWDFDADLFSAATNITSNNNTSTTRQQQQQQQNQSPRSNTSSPDRDHHLNNEEYQRKTKAARDIVSMNSDLATPELRKKHAERTTFWTLRRIIEKLQHRVKSVVQQRDAYKSLLGRYSYVASELREAAKRCDVATTILSDRYRRVVSSEMANRKIESPFPPGTVLFGNASSQQGKEVAIENSMASFGYPIEGFQSFVVTPQFVEPEQRSILKQPDPSQAGGGLGVPARGVDWVIIEALEKDAASVISKTHDDELRYLTEQLQAAYRRHNRDVKSVATMRRGVSDALDHCRYLERVILEKDNQIAKLDGEVVARDRVIDQEREKSEALRAQISDLMKIRYELDEELGKAGDNEHDLAENLKELKNMIAQATQKSEREATQRKEEYNRLRATMQDFSREFDGVCSIWKQQWKEVKIRSNNNNNNNKNKNNKKKNEFSEEVESDGEEDDNDENETRNKGGNKNSLLQSEASGITADFMKQVLEMNNKQKLDFSTQWVVLNEMFEQKRIDLSSRCSYEQVQAWNFIFKAILDLWHFAKQVQQGLKDRDDLLQQQYNLFEEQLRPILFELRQVDENARRLAGEVDADGKLIGGGGGGQGFGSALLRFQNRAAQQALASSSASGALSRRKSIAPGSGMLDDEDEQRKKNIKPPLEIRKEVAQGIERLKSFVGNFEGTELSQITKSFSLLFSEIYLKCDQVWSEEYKRMKEQYDTTSKKLAETQLNLSNSESSVEDLKKLVEELKETIADQQEALKDGRNNKRKFSTFGGGGDNRGRTAFDFDWSEGAPQLAAALDGVEARFDSLRSALTSTTSTKILSPSDLLKLRSELSEDLEHFEKAVHQLMLDENLSSFPEGFVPTACLAKIIKYFLQDSKWIVSSLSHSASGSLRNLSAEVQHLLTDWKKTRQQICSHVPAESLLEQGNMTEALLFQRAKNNQITHGLVGHPLRKFFFGFSHLTQSVSNVLKVLQNQIVNLGGVGGALKKVNGISSEEDSSSFGSKTNNNNHINNKNDDLLMMESTIFNATSSNTFGSPLLSAPTTATNGSMPILYSSDVKELLAHLHTTLLTMMEELQTTVVAGALGQWPTLHRAILQQQQQNQNAQEKSFMGSTMMMGKSTTTMSGTKAQNQQAALLSTMMMNQTLVQQQSPLLVNVPNSPLDETQIKLGGTHIPILERAIENALDLSLGPVDFASMMSSSNHNDASSSAAMFEGTIMIKPTANKVSNVEEAMKDCKMNTATARLILHRFEELVLCRGGMAAPFISSNVSRENNNNNNAISTTPPPDQALVSPLTTNKKSVDQLHPTSNKPISGISGQQLSAERRSSPSSTTINALQQQQQQNSLTPSNQQNNKRNMFRDGFTPQQPKPQQPATSETPKPTVAVSKESKTPATASKEEKPLKRKSSFAKGTASSDLRRTASTNNLAAVAEKKKSFTTGSPDSGVKPKPKKKTETPTKPATEKKTAAVSIEMDSTHSNNKDSNSMTDVSEDTLKMNNNNNATLTATLTTTTVTAENTNTNNLAARQLQEKFSNAMQEFAQNDSMAETRSVSVKPKFLEMMKTTAAQEEQKKAEDAEQKRESDFKYNEVDPSSWYDKSISNMAGVVGGEENVEEEEDDDYQVPVLADEHADEIFDDDDEEEEEEQEQRTKVHQKRQQKFVVETHDMETQYDPPILVDLHQNESDNNTQNSLNVPTLLQNASIHDGGVNQSPSFGSIENASNNQIILSTPQTSFGQMMSARGISVKQQQQRSPRSPIDVLVTSFAVQTDPSLLQEYLLQLSPALLKQNNNTSSNLLCVDSPRKHRPKSAATATSSPLTSSRQQNNNNNVPLPSSPSTHSHASHTPPPPSIVLSPNATTNALQPIITSALLHEQQLIQQNSSLAVSLSDTQQSHQFHQQQQHQQQILASTNPFIGNNNASFASSGNYNIDDSPHSQNHNLNNISFGGSATYGGGVYRNQQVPNNNSLFSPNSMTSAILTMHLQHNNNNGSFGGTAPSPLANSSFAASATRRENPNNNKTEQITRAVQVTMDPIIKPILTSCESQTDHTTHRQYVVSQPNVVSASSFTSSVGGVSVTNAVDFHRPPTSTKIGNGDSVHWIPAKWTKSDALVGLNENYDQEDSRLQEHGDTSNIIHYENPKSQVLGHTGPSHPIHRSRPPTPTKAESSWRLGGANMHFDNNNNKSLSSPSRVPSIPDSDTSTLREWKIKSGGGSIFLLKLERDLTNASVDADAQALARMSESARIRASSAQIIQRPNSPASRNIFGSNKISPFRNRRELLTPRSVFDVSQQLAKELNRFEQQELQTHQQNTTPPPSKSQHQQGEQHDSVSKTREMSVLRKKILQTGEEAEKNQFIVDQDNQTDRHLMRDLYNTTSTNTNTGRKMQQLQELTPQVFGTSHLVQRQQQQQRLQETLANFSTATASTTATAASTPQPTKTGLGLQQQQLTAVEAAIDPEFCREVGLTPQGAVKHRIRMSQMRRSDSPPHFKNANHQTRPSSSSVFVSRGIEKQIREKQMKQAKKYVLDYHDSLTTVNDVRGNQNDDKESVRKRKLEVEKEMADLDQDGLRVVALGTADGKKREFGNLSNLASTLCGPGSLLARKLSSV